MSSSESSSSNQNPLESPERPPESTQQGSENTLATNTEANAKSISIPLPPRDEHLRMHRNLELAQVHLHDIYRRIYKTRKTLPGVSDIVAALQKAQPYLVHHGKQWSYRGDQPAYAASFMRAATRLAKRVHQVRPDDHRPFKRWKLPESYLRQLRDRGVVPYPLWTRLPHVDSFYTIDSNQGKDLNHDDDEEMLSDFNPDHVQAEDDNDPSLTVLRLAAPCRPAPGGSPLQASDSAKSPSNLKRRIGGTIPGQDFLRRKRSRNSSSQTTVEPSPSLESNNVNQVRVTPTTTYNDNRRVSSSPVSCPAHNVIEFVSLDTSDEDEKDELQDELEDSVATSSQQVAVSSNQNGFGCLSEDLAGIPSTRADTRTNQELVDTNRSL